MKKMIFGGVLIVIFLVLSGCKNLSDIDLSGEKAMVIMNDSDGIYYKTVENFEETKFVPGYITDYYDIDRLISFFRELKLQGAINIGRERYHYTIAVTNRGESDSNIKIGVDCNGEMMKLGLVDSQSLLGYMELKDPNDLSWTYDSGACSGKDIYYFKEPAFAKIRFLITYNLKLSVTRKINTDENGVKTIEKIIKEIKFELKVKIGNPKYLYTEDKIVDSQGKYAQVEIVVSDSNLDGAFDDQDSFKIGANWGIFGSYDSTDWLPFGRCIKFYDNKTPIFTYIFDLKPNEDSYLLDIKKVGQDGEN